MSRTTAGRVGPGSHEIHWQAERPQSIRVEEAGVGSSRWMRSSPLVNEYF
jgi:hypothetical protein